MAQYKVPQDVEADDKLLGPFTFRQFIYLMVMGGCIALCFALFQVFPLLAIIPAPIAIFFAVLALPLKKDQPMETYLAAIVSFHLKPKKRIWEPGQRESTIIITAPKKVEQPRARNITGEEANTRLSFLANVVDSEGYSIRDNSSMQDDFAADNANAPDIFDNYSSPTINNIINREQDTRREALVNQMRAALNGETVVNSTTPQAQTASQSQPTQPAPQPMFNTDPTYNPLSSSTVIRPETPAEAALRKQAKQQIEAESRAKMTALANNKDYSIETIAKEAERIDKAKQDKEIYISLH